MYLNDAWDVDRDGGALAVATPDGDALVSPDIDRVVVFWARTAAHEVLPARRDRYALSMWFKVPRPLS